MELQINQSLKAQPPNFDFLPDQMLADVAAQEYLYGPRIILMAGSGR